MAQPQSGPMTGRTVLLELYVPQWRISAAAW